MRAGDDRTPRAGQALSRAEWEKRLAVFPTAPPELIRARVLHRRTDRKFVLPPRDAAGLIGDIGGEYARLSVANGPVADYRTIYFDTPDLECFHAHRRGRRVRHKVRIRHYTDRRLSRFEIKTRMSENETRKIWRERGYGDDDLTADDQAFVRAHTGIEQDVEPQAMTRFQRVTLLGLVIDERVTIDFDLEVSGAGRSKALVDLAIVEVKQWPFRPDSPVLSALRAAGRRPGWISKYCAAVAFTRADVQVNALLPGLRLLERGAAWRGAA